MHGEYKVRVKNSRNSYTFALRRNITVLRGDSGRGKTTLFDMIHEHNRFGKESGVSISSDRELIALTGDKWEDDILNSKGKIIVIDEDSRFIRSKDLINCRFENASWLKATVLAAIWALRLLLSCIRVSRVFDISMENGMPIMAKMAKVQS